MYPGQMGEAYCIVSDNAELDTRFEKGQKVDIELHENQQGDSAEPTTWGGFCEICGIQSAHHENCPRRQGPLI
jgi:hypothetical protein